VNTQAMEGAATRRELLRSGIAATAALSAVHAPGARAALAPGQGDAAVLARTLQIEQLVSIAYRRVLGSGALGPTVAGPLRGFLSQELEHVAALEQGLRGLGASVPASPASVASAQAALVRHHVSASLTRLQTQHQCLRLLIDVESLAEGAYFSAISKLSDPSLLRTSTEIMGCEAQHWTVLSSLQHHGKVDRAVPYPFVQGSS
jgi:hypothetical protein